MRQAQHVGLGCPGQRYRYWRDSLHMPATDSVTHVNGPLIDHSRWSGWVKEYSLKLELRLRRLNNLGLGIGSNRSHHWLGWNYRRNRFGNDSGIRMQIRSSFAGHRPNQNPDPSNNDDQTHKCA